ncbi:MAG: translocation/assembly module TamB domain-containing protein [Thermodesulfovibrionales bacterium]|nr:translocation/assembly module TamB domain-containing protein [Thermodesulfovibrionales bacterium]
MKKKKLIYITLIIIISALLIYALRGPNVSNAVKKLILPELELITGEKFIAQKAYINILPFFIEMKDIKAFDDNGRKILSANRVKAYIDFPSLFRKKIFIRKLSIRAPELVAERREIEGIAENIKKYLMAESKLPFKVEIKSVDIDNATVSFVDSETMVSAEKGNASIIFTDIPKFNLSMGKVMVVSKAIPKLYGSLETVFLLKQQIIEFKKLQMRSHDSEVKATGTFNLDKLSGEFKADLNLLAESIKQFYGLKNNGKGNISANGLIKIENIKSIDNIFMDMDFKGDMYLETLMELLRVEEKLRGFMSFKGVLKGHLNNIQGRAQASLTKGNLFDVDVDRLACNVTYHEGIMRFADGKASLYNGSASVNAMIVLPVVNHYSLNIRAHDINSKGLFKLIGWDPQIPQGKVTGWIESSGSEFNPSGKFYYKSISAGTDILGRIHEISGEFNMKDEIVRFPGLFVSTGKSNISSAGDVDISKRTLNFRGNGTTADINDFSSPYFTALTGNGKFQWTVSGKFDDPELDIRFTSNNISFATGELGIKTKKKVLNFNLLEADLNYKKKSLGVKNLIARVSSAGGGEFNAKGNVSFNAAQSLFEFKEPDYDLNINARRIDIKNLSEYFNEGISIGGGLNISFRLSGRNENIWAGGDFHATNLSLNGKHFVENAEGKVSYENKEFSVSSATLKKGNSLLTLNGKLSLAEKYSFAADSKRVDIADIMNIFVQHVKTPEQARFLEAFSLINIKMKGEGTFKNPYIEIKSGVQGGKYKGQPVGDGKINGVLKDDRVDIDAVLLGGKMNIKANATLSKSMPWQARVDMQSHRYDFLIVDLLKDVPEDLLLSLNGNIIAQGDINNINATATINRAHLNLYGISFTNSSDIIVTIENRKLSVKALSMKSDTTELKLTGNMLIGKNYDLLLEGSSSIAPLRAISKSIDIMKGDASFIFYIHGKWDKPDINGGMNINNGVLGFKDIPYRLTSISALIYIDEDRIFIEKAAGKISGGELSLSGTAYLEKFSIKKFFLESKLSGIIFSVSKDLWANFDGNLYYRGSMESQTLFGDINVKSARYIERVEWKSWLLKARPKEMPKIETLRLDKTNLNVKVSGANLTIDNNIAKANVKMECLLKGTIGRPILIGKLETKEGMVYFRNNEFKILKASADFSNPNQINPYFDIVADTKIKNYSIRLNLSGFIEQFTLSLSSSPPLDETDIFSLLTVGELGKHLKGLEGGIGAGEATSFLTGKLQDVFEERLKTVTGIDRVQVDPYISKSTGTVSPRVTLAKRLFGDKLYVTYSTSVSTGEEQIWKLEYLLRENIFLIGLRDERGGIGGDIKFRFEFK